MLSLPSLVVRFIQHSSLSHHFMESQLYEFSEKEIHTLLPNLKEVMEKSLIKGSSVLKESEYVETNNTECHLINSFKTKVFSRSDIKKLTALEQQEIKAKYYSVSVFLKKLKDAQ